MSLLSDSSLLQKIRLKNNHSTYINGTERNRTTCTRNANATSEGTGENSLRDGRKDYTDKSDPIIEHDCIWCMACVSVCPPQAIKLDQANLEFHEKAAGTFNEDLAKRGSSPPHAH